MFFFMRIIRPLLQQTWAAPAIATMSILSLAGGAVGWLVHWPYYPRFLFWGLIWGIAAVGARAINR